MLSIYFNEHKKDLLNGKFDVNSFMKECVKVPINRRYEINNTNIICYYKRYKRFSINYIEKKIDFEEKIDKKDKEFANQILKKINDLEWLCILNSYLKKEI